MATSASQSVIDLGRSAEELDRRCPIRGEAASQIAENYLRFIEVYGAAATGA